MGAKQSFDLTQTVFLFNWIANASAQHKGKEQALADYAYVSLVGVDARHPNPFPPLNPPGLLARFGSQLAGADWQLVWGPGVYEIDKHSGKADNSAFVVHSAAIDTYVVAIAGTNPSALLDWLEEDFEVGPKANVDWSTFSPTGSKPTGVHADQAKQQISLGTAIGVWALGSQLVQSQWAPDSATDLATYLQGLQPETDQTKVIVTGHSLGGALSPTLARWTHDNNSALAKHVLAMPTAGPTPGNQAYQAAWDTAFPHTPVADINPGNQVAVLNDDVWSTDDVVPHAWQYVYTPEHQTGSEPTDKQFFFSNPKPNWLHLYGHLQSRIGNLVTGAELRYAVDKLQKWANEAFMTRSSHTLPFSTKWPLEYVGKHGGVKTLNEPEGSFDTFLPHAFEKFLMDLGLIHVWGYGSSAFGIDFDVFKALHPSPSM